MLEPRGSRGVYPWKKRCQSEKLCFAEPSHQLLEAQSSPHVLELKKAGGPGSKPDGRVPTRSLRKLATRYFGHGRVTCVTGLPTRLGSQSSDSPCHAGRGATAPAQDMMEM